MQSKVTIGNSTINIELNVNVTECSKGQISLDIETSKITISNLDGETREMFVPIQDVEPKINAENQSLKNVSGPCVTEKGVSGPCVSEREVNGPCAQETSVAGPCSAENGTKK